MTSAPYELVDFGDGRKLEAIGGYLVDRPSPAAVDAVPTAPAQWSRAAARWEGSIGQAGVWTLPQGSLPEPRPAAWPSNGWRFQQGEWSLEMRLTDSGQVGVFPEQADNWRWLVKHICDARPSGEHTFAEPPRVLNLFAYTGASSLAAAAAGAAVTHVDAARSAVQWARHNAELSGLAQAPIRWIVEDARRFVQRELKRGRRYDAIVLDPPSYGHGPAGETWRFDEHLPSLLAACGELTAGRQSCMLLTCHSPGIGPREARQLLAAATPDRFHDAIEAGPLELVSRAGRRLNAGVMARYAAR